MAIPELTDSLVLAVFTCVWQIRWRPSWRLCPSVGQHKCELISAETHRRIGVPTTDAQGIGQAPKSLTTGHIAVAVVARFTASERFHDRNVYLSALVGAVALTVPEFQ